MGGKRGAVVLAFAFGALGACGRALPDDELDSPARAAPEGGAALDAGTDGAVAEASAHAGDASDANSLDADAGGRCVSLGGDCTAHAQCCVPEANRCIADKCMQCSTYGQVCTDDSDCCAVPKLACSTGSCCRPQGSPCNVMDSSGLECCSTLGCDLNGTCN